MQNLTIDKKREELKEKVRICNKNEKAILDILTFCYHLSIEYNYDSITNLTLLNNVIKELEDKEISIPLQAGSLEDFLKQQSHEYFKIMKELENVEMDEELEFLGDIRHDMLIHIYYDYRKQPFNFILNLLNKDTDYIYMLLVSEINLNKKMEILYSTLLFFIKNKSTFSLEGLLKSKSTRDSNFVEEQNKKKIEELLHYFKIWIIGRKKSLKESIFESSAPEEWIVFLQQKGLVDFLSETLSKAENKDESNSYTAVFFKLGNSLSNFKKFYELEEYRNIPEKIRNNDDKQILISLPLEEMGDFISLSNFKLTEEKVKIISERIMNYQKEREEYLETLINQIKDAIINKTEGEDDARQMFEYATKFLELTNYETYKERQREQLEENLFLRRLYQKN